MKYAAIFLFLAACGGGAGQGPPPFVPPPPVLLDVIIESRIDNTAPLDFVNVYQFDSETEFFVFTPPIVPGGVETVTLSEVTGRLGFVAVFVGGYVDLRYITPQVDMRAGLTMTFLDH